MKGPKYFRIQCPECSDGIEFPANGVGEEISCPHCQRAIVLRFPADQEGDPTEQMDAYLEMASFPKTRTQLEFLKQFTIPREFSELRGLNTWVQALGQSPESIIACFINTHMLQTGSADVEMLLQSKSKDDLKALTKTRDLSQSGTKEVLAKRLIKADPNGMNALFCGRTYLTCTMRGRLIVDQYVDSEYDLKAKAERATEAALRSQRYCDACEIVAKYEASRIFPRGVGIDWDSYSATRDLEILNEITTFNPGHHSDIPEQVLFSLRVSAGMMNLWGTNRPEKWLTGPEKEFTTEAHVLLSAAIEKVRFREMKSSGVKRVTVLGTGRDDVCLVCKKIDGISYPITSAPELPHQNCTCQYGCGCMLIAAR